MNENEPSLSLKASIDGKETEIKISCAELDKIFEYQKYFEYKRSQKITRPDIDDKDLLREAAKFIIECKKCSTSLLQRRLRIGYNRSAEIIDELAKMGVVSEYASGRRTALISSMEEFEEILASRKA